MTLVEPILVDSTLLASVLYDALASILQLELRDGAIYRYGNVPRTIRDGLIAADSKGEFFNREIRNRYPYIRLRPPR